MINQRDKDGELHGPWEYHHNNGRLHSKVTYNHGELIGPVEIYSTTSGKLSSRGEYKKGLRCGLWEDYSDTDGVILFKGGWKPVGGNLVGKQRGLFFDFRHAKQEAL